MNNFRFYNKTATSRTFSSSPTTYLKKNINKIQWTFTYTLYMFGLFEDHMTE